MTAQLVTSLGLAAALVAYAGFILYSGARRRRIRIEAVRKALVRRKRALAGKPRDNDVLGAV